MKKPTKDYIALALDNITEKTEILELVEQTKEYIGIFKIGLEQFIRFGPDIIKDVQKTGNKIFLDLKLHDIPNTVAKAVLAASELNVNYLTVHTCGGIAMLKAAVEAAHRSENPPKLIGVTILTSIDQNILNSELKIPGTITEHVTHLARIATDIKLDGIVCSAVDLPSIKQYLPAEYEIITPGIRPSGSDIGDQKRVATPQQAIENGATVLVIGRPITTADEPVKVAKTIFNSFEKI